MPGLSVSDLISVSVELSPTSAQTQNFGSLLLLDASSVIDTDERLRHYTSIDGVAADHGTSSEAYKASVAFYSQSPAPTDLYIGKWAESATAGLLYGFALSTSQQALTNFTVVTSGGMKVTIDGTLKSVSSLDFSGATTLPGIAAIVTTALASSGTVTWDAVNKRFQVKSATTGTSSTVSFASAPTSGTDVSALLGLTSGNTVGGIAAETMLDAVSILAAKSNDWYGLAIAVASPADADILAVAAYIEAASPRKIFFVTVSDADTLSSTSTDDLASQLKALTLNRTAVQYSSTSPYASVSLFARQASVNFAAQNSTITLMFKQEPTIAAETLTETQAATLKAKSVNVFVNYSNSKAIIQFGTMISGQQYIDSIVGLDWLQNDLQTALFNALYESEDKIPQSDAGANQLVNVAHERLEAAVNNGLIAGGVWNSTGFGALKQGQTLPSGYYVFAAPVSQQSSADRAARKCPPLQIAAKLAGAIHEVSAVIRVNQ